MGTVAAKVARCAEHMRLLDQVLVNRPYLTGAALSLADILAGTALYRYWLLSGFGVMNLLMRRERPRER